jgi:hypothetical protein
MAFLLPGAVLQADYASAVLGYVESRFADVLLVRVAERIFDDAAEETVVLLASNAYGVSTTRASYTPSLRLAEVNDLTGLQQFLANFVKDKRVAPMMQSTIAGVASWKAHAIRDCWELVTGLLEKQQVRRLGDVARVSLGTVTGANDFFLLNGTDTARLNVWDKTIPVVTRSAWLTGPVLSSRSLAENSADVRSRLLVLPRGLAIDRRTKIGKYIGKGEEAGLSDRRKCCRDPWWSLDPVPVPDAFLPYTVGYPRGIALNTARAASTNTVHQVTWCSLANESTVRSWALSTWSVLGRLSAEMFGRHYGGGVLKLELADAQKIPVVKGLRITKQEFAACARSTRLAQEVADSALLSSSLGLSSQDLGLLQEASERLAQKRRGPTRDAPTDCQRQAATAVL